MKSAWERDEVSFKRRIMVKFPEVESHKGHLTNEVSLFFVNMNKNSKMYYHKSIKVHLNGINFRRELISRVEKINISRRFHFHEFA